MRIDKAISKALDDTGLPWCLEYGKGHVKIRVADRLAGVVSTTPCPNPRAKHNTITQIRRLAAKFKGESQ
jgi:hypothetical protein